MPVWFRQKGAKPYQAAFCNISIGERQMRSIFGIPFSDLAGDAKRRVPLPFILYHFIPKK